MEKMKNSIVLFVMVLLSIFGQAQVPCPTCPAGSGGVGGTNPGARQSVPIDMYIYVLAIAAILMILYFAKKYKTQRI